MEYTMTDEEKGRWPKIKQHYDVQDSIGIKIYDGRFSVIPSFNKMWKNYLSDRYSYMVYNKVFGTKHVFKR